MSAQPYARMTEDEYLEFERAAEFRHEYYDGEVFAMSGGTATHAFIIANITSSLHGALRDKPCSVASSDFRVRISGKYYTYPDVVVVCDPIKLIGRDTLLNPALLVEVLSPSTENRDRTFKLDQYRQIESLQEYILVWQTEPRVEIFRRDASGRWINSTLAGLESTAVFASVEVSIPLTAIYHRIDFSSEAALPDAEI
jgi:Uma2 family endonuclease